MIVDLYKGLRNRRRPCRRAVLRWPTAAGTAICAGLGSSTRGGSDPVSSVNWRECAAGVLLLRSKYLKGRNSALLIYNVWHKL